VRVIGVLDVVRGTAVHARGGIRRDYAPVSEAAGVVVNGDPVALAHVYLDTLGLQELYVADLDAIAGGDPNNAAITGVIELGRPTMVDAGVRAADDATRVAALGATTIVVGLETLPSFAVLRAICTAVQDRIAFSLDLRHGQPIGIGETPETLAAHAADAGVRTLIVLDVGRVGMRGGPDMAMIRRIRQAVPDLSLLAGGGVRGADDLNQLADAGYDGALVATALHEGRLTIASRDRPPSGRNSPRPPSRSR
jgi:phosphoribosylformimino-5-aminoimidazole carboxamide ribotide isomerase